MGPPVPVYPPLSQVEPIAPIDNSGLPPGSKIIAEYILGYLDEQPQPQPPKQR